LPEGFVEVAPMTGSGGHGLGSYGASRFDEAHLQHLCHPAGARPATLGQGDSVRSTPHLIEGEMTARETEGGGLSRGERIFHQKFGYGSIRSIDGNKLTIDFEKATRSGCWIHSSSGRRPSRNRALPHRGRDR
jgi:DNA helicase-2/ATP-dependent DNA helicase PcrA